MVMEGFEILRGSEEHIAVVKEMGLGELLKVNCKKMPKDLVIGLVRKFDPVNRKLVVGKWSENLDVGDVGAILRLPCGRRNIPTKVESRTVSEMLEIVRSSTGNLKKMLLNSGCGVVFRQVVMAFLLTSFLCPTSAVHLDRRAYGAVAVSNEIEQYDLASFVLDWLCDGITAYRLGTKKKKGQKKSCTIGGCVFLLMVSFICSYLYKNAFIILY